MPHLEMPLTAGEGLAGACGSMSAVSRATRIACFHYALLASLALHASAVRLGIATSVDRAQRAAASAAEPIIARLIGAASRRQPQRRRRCRAPNRRQAGTAAPKPAPAGVQARRVPRRRPRRSSTAGACTALHARAPPAGRRAPARRPSSARSGERAGRATGAERRAAAEMPDDSPLIAQYRLQLIDAARERYKTLSAHRAATTTGKASVVLRMVVGAERRDALQSA